MSTQHRKNLKILTIAAVIGALSWASAVSAVTYPPYKINYSPSRQLVAPQLASTNMSGAVVNDFVLLSVASSTITTPGSVSYSTASDTISVISLAASYIQGCVLSVQAYPGKSIGSLRYMSITPSLGTVDQNGGVAPVASGTALINVTADGRTRQTGCPVGIFTNSPITSWYSFVDGSLASSTYSTVAAMIRGKTYSPTTYKIFSGVNDSTHVYTRNTSVFTGAQDLSAIPAVADSGTGCTGTLIAPDVLLGVNHCQLSIGTTLYFVDAVNVSTSTSITSGMRVVDPIYGGTDLYVFKLNKVLGPTIVPAKVFPVNGLTNKFTGYSEDALQIPIIREDQDRNLQIYLLRRSQFTTFIAAGPVTAWWAMLEVPNTTIGQVFNGWRLPTCRPGDSGHGNFSVVNGSLVVIELNTYCTSGMDVSQYIPEINAAMTTLGSSYQVTQADLSGFPTY